MKIIFRADGNSSTGLGHIMRSCALMQILQPHFNCEFWTRNPSYFPVKDFAQPPLVVSMNYDDVTDIELLSRNLPEQCIVVLDGYQFNTAYQRQLKNERNKIVCIDDIMSFHFVADAIINHAGGLQPHDYSCESYTELYLGPQYALIKPLFYQNEKPKRQHDNPRLLISLGGADPDNSSDKILETLLPEKRFAGIHMVLGPANKNLGMLQTKWNFPFLHFHQSLSGQQLYELMYACDEAILSPSTVCYEYMSLGGTVYLHQIADNQQRIKEYFIQEGLAFPFETIGRLTPAQMDSALHKQRQLFNGRSPELLLDIFTHLAN